MAVRNQDLILYTDSHDIIVITVEDITSLESANNVVWKLGRSKTAQPLILKTLGDGITVEDNKITITLLPEDTADLRQGDYYHEARVTTAEGNSRPVTVGNAKIMETLTSSTS